MCGGKILSWGEEKNTLLKKLLVRLPCVFFKSVFFCAVAFPFFIIINEFRLFVSQLYNNPNEKQ